MHSKSPKWYPSMFFPHTDCYSRPGCSKRTQNLLGCATVSSSARGGRKEWPEVAKMVAFRTVSF
eukprot:151472-Amorphochlora_amoeboformis.AAC.1